MLEGKVAVVTGGNTGIGRAVALRLAKAGVKVVVNYVCGDLSVVDEIKNHSEGVALKADVTKPYQVKRMKDKIKERYGRVDILINNAGILEHRDFKDLDMEDWKKVFDVNMMGVFNVAKEISSLMDEGKIVNVGSMRGVMGSIHNMHYSASKSAVINFTRSLAKELAPKINVNCVSPGITETDSSKKYERSASETAKRSLLNRKASPDEIARTIIFLASDDASYITGENLVVDGGYTIN